VAYAALSVHKACKQSRFRLRAGAGTSHLGMVDGSPVQQRGYALVIRWPLRVYEAYSS
jgi:hypothetical protein